MFLLDHQIVEKNVSKDPNHSSNVEFVKRRCAEEGRNVPGSNNMSNEISGTRNKFIKMIKDHNEQLLRDLTDDQLSSLSLEYLDSIIKANGIEEKPTRKAEWREAEIAIANGFQKLLDDDFFTYTNKGRKVLKVNSQKFGVEHVGGSKESDVKIFRLDNPKLRVYIESKLNFMTAEYFKFKLHMTSSSLTYDHKFFLGGLDDEQKKEMDELFKAIDLNGFLNQILQSSDVKEYWLTFIENINAVYKNLKTDADFAQFAELTSLPTSFPGNTNVLLKVFDLYCKHYIEKYDSIVQQIYDSYGGSQWMDGIDDYLVYTHNGENGTDYEDVFLPVDLLMVNFHTWNDIFQDQGQQPYDIDEKKIIALSDELKTIEIKLDRIMRSAGISNPRRLLDLPKSKKLLFFFKGFLSSVGRKSKGINHLLKLDLNDLENMKIDELGNMQITPEIVVEGDKLAKMIADYYVKKDQCAYIQIGDLVCQFKETSNTFQIPNIPIMSDVIKKFIVKVQISDEVDAISLHIRAVPPEEKDLQGYNIISFKQKDPNFIEKKMKGVEIRFNN